MRKIYMCLVTVAACAITFTGTYPKEIQKENHPVIQMDASTDITRQNITSRYMMPLENKFTLNRPMALTYSNITSEETSNDKQSIEHLQQNMITDEHNTNSSDAAGYTAEAEIVGKYEKSEPSAPTTSVQDNHNTANVNTGTNSVKPTTSSEPRPVKPSQNTNTANQNITLPTNPKPEQTTPTKPTTPSKPVVQETVPVVCTEHDYIVANTTIDEAYPLYNQVTYEMKCSQCGETYNEGTIASNGTSYFPWEASAIIAEVNSLRQSNGLAPLIESGDWNAWAQMRAEELSTSYGHARPDGSSCMTKIGDYVSFAENIAAGCTSGYNFFNAFCNSGTHYSAMMYPDAKVIGVGIYVSADGESYCAMSIGG